MEYEKDDDDMNTERDNTGFMWLAASGACRSVGKDNEHCGMKLGLEEL